LRARGKFPSVICARCQARRRVRGGARRHGHCSSPARVFPSSVRAATAVLLLLSGAVVSASCGLGLLEGGPPGIAVRETKVRLHEHDLTLHLVTGVAHPEGPLLLYATGDAGWWGSDKALF